MKCELFLSINIWYITHFLPLYLALSVPVVLINSPNVSSYFSLNKFERILFLIFISLRCLISSHFLITKCLILYVLCKEKLGGTEKIKIFYADSLKTNNKLLSRSCAVCIHIVLGKPQVLQKDGTLHVAVIEESAKTHYAPLRKDLIEKKLSSQKP